MDIIYAAEKASIAHLLSAHARRQVAEDEITVAENPDETGSFFIGWRLRRYVMTPSGRILPRPGRR